MKVTSVWKEDFKSVVDNGRGQEYIMDLPMLQNGNNEGPTALEASVMAYAGCITTIFAMIARKSHVEFSEMKCSLDAEKGVKTIETADILLEIRSEAPEEKLEHVFDLTCQSCPVGVLFIQGRG